MTLENNTLLICNKKQLLREEILSSLKILDSEYCNLADEKIHENLLEMDEFSKAKVVFTYVSRCKEVNTFPIIQYLLTSGKQVAVPKCLNKGHMEAYLIQSVEELKEGKYGILEPDSTTNLPIEPQNIDLVITPCLSADNNGYRLGYGGGFYDRYLLRTSAIRILLCRNKIMKDDVPFDIHDQKMDVIVTEERIIRFDN